MNITKKWGFCGLLLLSVTLLGVNGVFAGISKSPHDVASWYNMETATGTARAGICAYCHIPHSAKGERLFPEQTTTEVGQYGNVGAICYKCHGTTAYMKYVGNAGWVLAEIFQTMDTAIAADSTKMDSHPTNRTDSTTQPKSLQNTVVDTSWPWTSTWASGAKGTKAIECSTCHNPHNWNEYAYGTASRGLGQRKFLRAPVYDSGGPAGKANFCSYCHTNREDTSRTNTLGTHPVSSRGGFASFSNCTTGSYKNDTAYMIKSFSDSATVAGAGSKAGKAVWDSLPAYNRFIGARIYGTDKIICQTCHMPHGVFHSDDDVYQDTDTTELRVGPLLAINNAGNWAETVGYRPKIGDYPWTAESVYTLPASDGEENLLCEWCHGMTPDLESSAESTAAFAHPVNRYPSLGNGTKDNLPSETTHGFGTMWIKYPETTWLKYRESGGIRKAGSGNKNPVAAANPSLAPGDRPTNGYYLICLSCHEPHNADTTNGYLLKKGSGTNPAGKSFCDGCHKDMAMGTCTVGDTLYFTTWTTHPSGPGATLLNIDGGLLPNRAGLKVFDVSYDSGYVSCWTCHKAHKGVAKPVLADYQEPFSQICVNCHCEGGSPVPTPRVTLGAGDSSKVAEWKYGTAGGQTNANPSKFYKEGYPGWWASKTSGTPGAYTVGDSTRLGSHYIGKFSGDRPDTGAVKGWLGERTADRGDGKYLTAIVHYSSTTSEKDYWLSTAGFIDTVWAGSGQKGHVPGFGAGETANVIICQSCHAVHNSAKGVVDDSAVSRLLLASNYDSYMCKRCHIPEPKVDGVKTRSHPMHIDKSPGGYVYNTTVTITKSTVNTDNSPYAYKYAAAWAANVVYAPANYPMWTAGEHRMTCESCHSVHSAQSRMGAMILEGPDSTSIKTSNAPPNKVPTFGERDDKPTCRLCHSQGTD